jgi:DNA-binding FadR family transcriptional regulator
MHGKRVAHDPSPTYPEWVTIDEGTPGDGISTQAASELSPSDTATRSRSGISSSELLATPVRELDSTDNGRLAVRIAADLERYIIELGWPVGRILYSEAELIAKYGASRSIIREAVRLLEQHTTARMRRGPGGGLVVCAPEADSVTNIVSVYLEYQKVVPNQLFEARVALELSAVELAAARLTESGIARLKQCLEDERNLPVESLWQHTRDIHVVIAEMAESPAFPLFITVLAKLVDARSTEVREDEANAIYYAHSRIVEAIIAGDAALARHRMRRHLEAVNTELPGRRR